MRPRGSHGFTLIELMIVVAIIAILASIAIPSYRDYIIRGHLAEATSTLASYQAKMERYYQDNRTYADAAPFTSPCGAGEPDTRKVGEFQISCGANAPTLNGYTVLAQGTGSMSQFALTINERGDQGTVDTAPGWGGRCDRRWRVKKGIVCPT